MPLDAAKSVQSNGAPLRLALVTTELRPGGAERNWTSLAIGLTQHQFAPHVYSLAAAPPAGKRQLVDSHGDAEILVSPVNVQRPWQLLAAAHEANRRRVLAPLPMAKPLRSMPILYRSLIPSGKQSGRPIRGRL